MELCPLLDCSTNSVMQAFYDNVVLRHGMPNCLRLDRASYFTSDSIKAVAKLLGCELKYSLSHIHISHGTAEAAVRTVASQLGKLCTENPSKWLELLKSVMHSHNTFAHLGTQMSPHLTLKTLDECEIVN